MKIWFHVDYLSFICIQIHFSKTTFSMLEKTTNNEKHFNIMFQQFLIIYCSESENAKNFWVHFW